jgi:hypothetical protein
MQWDIKGQHPPIHRNNRQSRVAIFMLTCCERLSPMQSLSMLNLTEEQSLSEYLPLLSPIALG